MSSPENIPSVPEGATGTDVPDVSVVVPAYFGCGTIVGCLESVRTAAAQWNCQILVVESSGDGTVELVRTRFPEVEVVTSPHRLSAGQARNEGIRRASGRWVLCVDQDCVVPPDWIDRLVALLRRPGTGAAGGSLAVANPGNLSGWCVYLLEFLNHYPSKGPVREDNFLVGANSAWCSQAVRRVKFPDQTLGEDLLASREIRRLGFAVRYDPTITVSHHNRSGWREFGRYCRAMGKAAAEDQSRLGGRAIVILQKCPALSFGIPLVILPRIVWRLLEAPRGYLARFLQLFPICLLGQILWAASFRQALLQARARESAAR